MKTIYLEPDEEIISVIDRLTQTKIKKVNLVVPMSAQIWQNSINLKLLKRESDNLGKEITLFVPDDLKAEAAQRIGFVVKKEKNFPVELIREEEKEGKVEETELDKEDMIGLLVEELRPEKEKKRSFGWPRRSKEPRKKMADIVVPGDRSEIIRPRAKTGLVRDRQARDKFFASRFLKRKPVVRPMPKLEPREVEPIFKRKETPPSRWPKFFIIFIGLTFLVVALVGYLALPTTEIVISPKT